MTGSASCALALPTARSEEEKSLLLSCGSAGTNNQPRQQSQPGGAAGLEQGWRLHLWSCPSTLTRSLGAQIFLHTLRELVCLKILPSPALKERPLGQAYSSEQLLLDQREVKSALRVSNGKDDPLQGSRSESFAAPVDLQAFSCTSAFHISSEVSEIWKPYITRKEWPSSLLSFYLFNKYGI